ncbi:MAG: aminopeptidase P family protein [Aestuariivirgaceae bacterium]
MLKTSDPVTEKAAIPRRLEALRAELKNQGIDGFIVPRQDEFQGEYVAAYAERLRWLTGFAGSWGVAVILLDKAAIFVDGRYTLQVTEQVDSALFTRRHLIDEPPHEWVQANLAKGQVLGYDPWLLTADQVDRFRQAAAKAGGELRPVDRNPVDAVWQDRPHRPNGPVEIHPTQLAGRTAADKLAETARSLEAKGADAAIITLPDSIAWLFNIRGHDVAHSPVVHAQAIVRREGKADLFIEPQRISEEVADHLAAVANTHPREAFISQAEVLGREKAKVLADLSSLPEKVRSAIESAGGEIVSGPDPTVLPKARKNHVEQEGARNAHKRDGAAMARFLRWLESEAPKGQLTEIGVADKLEEFRRSTGALKDLSFDTIAGAGPNAAIPHYHVSRDSDRRLEKNAIFLVDSGAQYEDGTTDITRTVIVGEPAAEMRDRFTRVLKGMIGISTIRFPKGTTGSQIDVLARAALWKAGYDYDHGTGHGVGSYLSVHEGPARINKTDRTLLEPGMILSNEPGYYKPGHYGIRIENLVLVHEPQTIEGGERPMMGFETLTLAPIDRRLVDAALLTEEELSWLNGYHARVAAEIGPLLEGADREWLMRACAPVARVPSSAARR